MYVYLLSFFFLVTFRSAGWQAITFGWNVLELFSSAMKRHGGAMAPAGITLGTPMLDQLWSDMYKLIT